MEVSDKDRLFAEIINGILSNYCKELGFDKYLDYEFLTFYATRGNSEKAVGAISGTVDKEFINGVYTLLSRIQGRNEDSSQDFTKGLVDE